MLLTQKVRVENGVANSTPMLLKNVLHAMGLAEELWHQISGHLLAVAWSFRQTWEVESWAVPLLNFLLLAQDRDHPGEDPRAVWRGAGEPRCGLHRRCLHHLLLVSQEMERAGLDSIIFCWFAISQKMPSKIPDVWRSLSLALLFFLFCQQHN